VLARGSIPRARNGQISSLILTALQPVDH